MDNLGTCQEPKCKFRKICAQHYSADAARMDGGFSPEIHWGVCRTVDKDMEMPISGHGFIHSSKIQQEQNNIPENIFE